MQNELESWRRGRAWNKEQAAAFFSTSPAHYGRVEAGKSPVPRYYRRLIEQDTLNRRLGDALAQVVLKLEKVKS